MSTDKTSYIKTNKPLYIANLVARMEKNEQLGTFDFERWVFGHADYAPGCELLDVACGSGKAIFKLLTLHPRIGRITGVDFAESAIRMLADQARERRLDNVEPLLLDMETLIMTLAGRRFDHLYSIYGAHYSPRLVDLLREYRTLLKPGGTMFVCGPDAFSNTPLMRILGRLDAIERDPIPMRMLRPFIGDGDLERLREHFAVVELDLFENQIRFPDVDAFMAWWRNHDLYRDWAEPLVRQEVARAIREHGAFVLNKNVLGVSLRTTGAAAR